MKTKFICTTVFDCSVLMMLLFGCDKSIDTGETTATLTQIAGCRPSALHPEPASEDSCFSYEFRDALIVNFCAFANCCPDSNRFTLRHAIRNDTIAVTIADTTAHLCRCTCTYTLHAEFHNLLRNQYQFMVCREDYSSRVVIYSERVYRR